MCSAGHRQAHAEENDAEPGPFHPGDDVLDRVEGQADFGDTGLVDGLVLHERPHRRAELEILARLDDEGDIRRPGRGRFADVDGDHRPPLATFGDELALLGDGVLAEMPWMAFRRVPAPVNNEVRGS
jgi:hypothetical protein